MTDYTPPTWAETLAQAVGIGIARADRTGVRQRVAICACGGAIEGRHFTVKPVDRMPSAVMA